MLDHSWTAWFKYNPEIYLAFLWHWVRGFNSCSSWFYTIWTASELVKTYNILSLSLGKSHWSNWVKKTLLLHLNRSFADLKDFWFGSWAITVKGTKEFGKVFLCNWKQAGKSTKVMWPPAEIRRWGKVMGSLNLGFLSVYQIIRTSLGPRSCHMPLITWVQKIYNQTDLCSIWWTGPLITHLEARAMSNCYKSFWMLASYFQTCFTAVEKQIVQYQANASLTATHAVVLVWIS